MLIFQSHRFVLALAVTLLPCEHRSPAQETSVRPGINDSYLDPDKNVDEWVTRFEGESREVYDNRYEIVAACEIEPGMTVADIGAGTGLFTRLFADAVGDEGLVYANDISPTFVKHIAASADEFGLENVITILGRDKSAELPEGEVDLVFLCDVYHHFEYPEWMMRSIHQALKPEGRLIVIDFVREEGISSDWVLDHVRAGQAVFEEEITSVGFRKVREIDDLLTENYMIEFKKTSPPSSSNSR